MFGQKTILLKDLEEQMNNLNRRHFWTTSSHWSGMGWRENVKYPDRWRGRGVDRWFWKDSRLTSKQTSGGSWIVSTQNIPNPTYRLTPTKLGLAFNSTRGYLRDPHVEIRIDEVIQRAPDISSEAEIISCSWLNSSLSTIPNHELQEDIPILKSDRLVTDAMKFPIMIAIWNIEPFVSFSLGYPSLLCQLWCPHPTITEPCRLLLRRSLWWKRCYGMAKTQPDLLYDLSFWFLTVTAFRFVLTEANAGSSGSRK